MIETKPPTGHIHAGKRIAPGGRYDRFLSFLRAHPGASTLEIIQGADVCAVSAIAAELRQMGFQVDCELEEVSCTGSKRYRYTVVEKKGGTANHPIGNDAAPDNEKQEELF